MPLLGSSLLTSQLLKETDVFSLFDFSKKIRELHLSDGLDFQRLLSKNAGKYVAMVFLEPSTRTRASFEAAAYKLGIRVLAPEFGSGSSRSKGESLADTFLTISAMKPNAIVLRSAESAELQAVVEVSPIPVINGGWGAVSHPTQALLDAFTIYEEFGEVRGKKVLIAGDIKHSRVAGSNIELLQSLGAEVALCGPEEFMPQTELQRFSIEDGLAWADAAMALRIQLERHDGKTSMSGEDYHREFGIDQKRLGLLGEGILMHPGPVNQGIEISREAMQDPRCKILKQVENGVYIRAAVLAQILGIEI